MPLTSAQYKIYSIWFNKNILNSFQVVEKVIGRLHNLEKVIILFSIYHWCNFCWLTTGPQPDLDLMIDVFVIWLHKSLYLILFQNGLWCLVHSIKLKQSKQQISCFAHKIRNVCCLPRCCTLICIKFMALGTASLGELRKLILM